MLPREMPEPPVSRRVLTGLGGGRWREVGERHERSTHAMAGVVVLLGAASAWLVATLAVSESTRWPIPAILPLTLVFGLLIGAVTRATASGPTPGWPGIVGRGVVAVAVGVVVGEFAALVLLSGSIDRRLDEQAARNAGSTPAVVAATANLAQTRDARVALDSAVEQAHAHRDEALVVARCEYHPTPNCPQTRITGVPGVGPETRTANEFLADSQRELDDAVSARERRAPELDSQIADGEQALARAREVAVADADRGLGARWVTMNDLTLASAGPLLVRLIAIAFFTLLSLLPLILRLWRGETTQDRHAAARTQRDRAETKADTAIAVKRAQVRAEAETIWADQQLANARLAAEAQNEIDRAQHRRRVTEALGGAAAQLSSRAQDAGLDEPVDEPENLPAEVESASATEARNERGTPVPPIPDFTRAAARWIRPLVPPFVARAIDTTTQPLRAAREVFEEIEEITFSLKRTRKVIVNSESHQHSPGSGATATGGYSDRIESSVVCRGPSSDLPPNHPDAPSLEATGSKRRPELMQRAGSDELDAPDDGPRQLPSAE